MQEDKYKRCPDNKGAVLNTDARGLLTYKQQKEKQQRINNSFNQTRSEIKKINNEISEIKDLLFSIAEKIK